MGDYVWLAGVYRGELVTVNEHYKKEVWNRLPVLRKSNFLESFDYRQMLEPYFFFLRPVKGAKLLKDIPKKDLTLEDFGLQDIAYESMCGPSRLPNHYRIPAKGECKGNGFVVKMPAETATKLPTKGVAVLAHSDKSPPKGGEGITRTGTFFNYEILEREKALYFTPLECRGRYLTGKGVLFGAWKLTSSHFGGMLDDEYPNEKDCPLNIASAKFKKKFLLHEQNFYITYRAAETDLRMDMPAAYLHLARIWGFKSFAENLGSSMNHALRHGIYEIDQRNVLADGSIVDYEVNRKQEDKQRVKELGLDVFQILFLSAVASLYHGKGLLTLLQGVFATHKESYAFVRRNFKEIKERYQTLAKRFMGGLDASNRKYFKREYDETVPSLVEIETLFKAVTGLGLQITSQKQS